MTVASEPAPLPIQPGPRPGEAPLPKALIAVLVVCASFGAAGLVASVVAAKSSIAQQDDVLRNREYLQSTCENTRAVTEAFTTASPAPCPTGP